MDNKRSRYLDRSLHTGATSKREQRQRTNRVIMNIRQRQIQHTGVYSRPPTLLS
jgi:hypothetical protein